VEPPALRSECETCGAWSPFTGRTELRDGLRYAVMRCEAEGIDFAVWRPEFDELLPVEDETAT
jgi:hypothetical protein